MSIYDKIFRPKTFTISNGKSVSQKRSRAPLAVVILLAMTILSVKITGFSMVVLTTRIKEFFVILGQMFPPKWDYMPSVWQPLFDTIKMSLLGSFIGSVLVVPFVDARFDKRHSEPCDCQPDAPVLKYRAYPADSGYRADCNLHFRTRNACRYDRNRSLYVCIHRKDPL